jgi:outer membrane protein assembly factor BamD (BamD/ComL family)
MRRLLPFCLVLALALPLAACASKTTDEQVEAPVEELYNQAADAMAAEQYSRAAQ